MVMKVILPSDVYRKETIVGCIYGPPGLRKTTLGFTADRPLLLDFDGGVHRASFRRAFVPVETWDDVLQMERSDFDGYGTAVVDTAGRAIDALGRKIIERDPKMANKSGGLSLQGFGALKTEFAAWLRKLRGFGLNVLLILHSEEQKDGDSTVVRIDAQGASKQEIYKVSDFMGSITINHEGAIALNLSPSDVAFGKNPANLPPMLFKTIDGSSTHMAKVFSQTLEKINAMTEEQREVSAALEAWRVRIMEAPDAAALTALTKDVPTDPRVTENAKRVLWSVARDRGFTYDKDRGEFVPKDANVVKFPAGTPAQEAACAPQAAQDAPAEQGGGKEPDAAPTAHVAQEGSLGSLREPGDEGPDAELSPAELKRQRLGAVFAEKYPEPDALMKAFKKADADVFFKGKLRGARSSPADLSDMDVAIMLHAIENNQLSI